MQHQFWAVTAKALASLGLMGVKFSTHSFHIGVMSMASALGYSEERVKSLGQWCSQAFWTYVCPLQF